MLMALVLFNHWRSSVGVVTVAFALLFLFEGFVLFYTALSSATRDSRQTLLDTRVVEWLAFHFGGPAGKQLSLTFRLLGAAVTSWLIAIGRPANARRPE
jgi:hypothetical protein